MYFQEQSENKESPSSSELWISIADSSFVFRHFEDEWNDWPYPHTMEHILSGSLKWPEPKERMDDTDISSLKKVIENSEFILERMIYTTLTEDDLFYDRSMEIFDLQKEDDLSFNKLYTKLCQKEEDFLFPVRPETAKSPKNFYETHRSNFIILKAPESKWPNFKVQLNTEVLTLSWARFPRKWSRHSDGTDVVCGGVPEKTVMGFNRKNEKHKSIPEILSVLKKG